MGGRLPPVDPPQPAEPTMDLLSPLVDGIPMSPTREWLYQVTITIAVLALMATAFMLGRTTDHPKPDVYVVHQDELTTTTVTP